MRFQQNWCTCNLNDNGQRNVNTNKYSFLFNNPKFFLVSLEAKNLNADQILEWQKNKSVTLKKKKMKINLKKNREKKVNKVLKKKVKRKENCDIKEEEKNNEKWLREVQGREK